MLILALASAADLDRYPYLQSTTTDSTTVLWWTFEDSDGSVSWGPSGEALDQSASSTTGTAHAVALTGLEASTAYDYRVEDGDGELLGEGTFTTHPPVGEPARVRLWAIGDSGTGNPPQFDNYETFQSATEAERPLAMLHLGDIAYHVGSHEEFSHNFFAVYADFLAEQTVYPTIGNHEAFTSTSEDQSGPYFEAFVLPTAGELGGVASGTEAYYSFDLANMHVIVLDSADTDRAADGAMALWLEQDLAATTQDWIVATWHHPPYSKGTHDSDMDIHHIEMREHMVPLLEAGGVDLVLSGHSHIYERSYLLDGAYDTPTTDAGVLDNTDGALEGDGPYQKPEGITANNGAVYVVAGHGGTGVGGEGGHPVMYMHEVEWGNVLIDLDDDHLTLRNLRIDGTYTDEFTLVKGDDLVLNGPDGEADFAPGDTVDISWTMIGDLGPVDIEWTCDGETWEPLAEDLEDATSWTWSAPEIQTRTGRVRVSAGDESDVSDAPFGIVKTHSEMLVDWGSTWKYSDTDGELPEDWMGNGFDDSAWKEGPAELGTGDGDEATEVTLGQPTFYFRLHFENDQQLENAELDILYDDAAAVWLNGEFVVFTPNMGSTDYDAYANYASADNKVLEFPLNADLIRDGDNVLAVLVKQADEDSTDLSFDLSLEVDVIDELDRCDGVEDTGGDSDPPTDSGPTESDTQPDSVGDSEDDRKPYDPGCCGGRCGGGGSAALILLLLPFVLRRR